MNVFSDLKLNSKTSVYLQIIQHVKRKILNKSIIAYTPLPSRRELASLLSINPNTIQRAYAELERRGVIYAAKGRGNFISDETAALCKRRLDEIGAQVHALADQARSLGAKEEQIREWVEQKGDGTA